jgi:hypothetical protein
MSTIERPRELPDPSRGERLNSDNWAWRCPEGHTDLAFSSSERVRCGACQRTYSLDEITHALSGATLAQLLPPVAAESHREDGHGPREPGGSNGTPGTSITSVTDGQRTDAGLWACDECGNLVVADERPRRCLNCRRGVSEYRLDELYREVATVEVEA